MIIAAGDTAEEIDEPTRGGDSHIDVWGGVRRADGVTNVGKPCN